MWPSRRYRPISYLFSRSCLLGGGGGGEGSADAPGSPLFGNRRTERSAYDFANRASAREQALQRRGSAFVAGRVVSSRIRRYRGGYGDQAVVQAACRPVS